MYPSPPTNWSTIYVCFKICFTIVSLDLQLLLKCMQMRENPNIQNNSIFRLDELHDVFIIIKMLGKYIENSGFGKLFVETGIYGEASLSQIIKANIWSHV